MFDLGWSELLVIGVVALIVVGPKDLPVMFRNVGRMTGKAKAMAREFTSAMNAAADEAGMKDIQRDLNKIGNMANPRNTGLKAVQDAADALEKWDPEIEPAPQPKTVEKPAAPAAEAPASAAEPDTKA